MKKIAFKITPTYLHRLSEFAKCQIKTTNQCGYIRNRTLLNTIISNKTCAVGNIYRIVS